MVQWAKVLAAKSDDMSFIPMTYVKMEREITHIHVHTHTHGHMHAYMHAYRVGEGDWEERENIKI